MNDTFLSKLKNLSTKEKIYIIITTIAAVLIIFLVSYKLLSKEKVTIDTPQEPIATIENDDSESDDPQLNLYTNLDELDQIFYECFPKFNEPTLVADKQTNLIWIFSASLSSNYDLVNGYFTSLDSKTTLSNEEILKNYSQIISQASASAKCCKDSLKKLEKVDNMPKEKIKQINKLEDNYELYISNLKKQSDLLSSSDSKSITPLQYISKFRDSFSELQPKTIELESDLPNCNNSEKAKISSYYMKNIKVRS